MFGFVALVLKDCSLIANSMPHINIWFTYSHMPLIVTVISCFVSMGVSLCFECVLMAFHDAYKLALFQVEWNWFPNIKNSKKSVFLQQNPVPRMEEPVPRYFVGVCHCFLDQEPGCPFQEPVPQCVFFPNFFLA